jgi:hypothetical protein
MNKNYFLKSFFIGFIGLSTSALFGQTYSFTNCGQTGAAGPSQAQVTAAYTATNLNGNVAVNTQGIQEWTVPSSGLYSITTIGACGGEGQGSYHPGLPGTGATISGEFNLTAGMVINIVVGQKGVYDNNGSGGGGGTFVFTGAPNGAGAMIVAGGGGGHGHGSPSFATGANGGGGSATTAQVDGAGGNGNGGSSGVGQGGNTGVGCSASGHGSGGTGWLSDGLNASCGVSNGGSSTIYIGGSSGQLSSGGFGGGGGTYGSGSPGGGGGGYTGGGGGNTWTGSVWGAGAGAGSYNLGANQVNTAGVTGAANGHTEGSVTIVALCSGSSSTFTVDDCDAYTVPSGDTTYMASGVYNDTIPNVSGCDSVMTITVNVTSLDLNTTTTDFTITANQASGNYQWINCSDNSLIAGETNQSFTADANGDYAVILADGPCSDTSACATIAGVGIDEDGSLGVSIYPNPSQGEFYISTVITNMSISVFSIDGKMIINHLILTESNQLVNLRDIEKGIYFVEISNQNTKETMRLIVE